MFGRLFQKSKKKADDSRIAEEAPRVVEETPQTAEKNYRIVVVKEDQAKLRKNAVKFLNDHGFDMEDFTEELLNRSRGVLRNFKVENASSLDEKLIVALPPSGYEIYGAVHASTMGSAVQAVLTNQGFSEQEKIDYSEALLRRILLSKLAVDPAYGGQGIGRALVDKAIEFARTGGYEVICGQIDTEVGDNDKLTKFYEDCGFTVVSPNMNPVQMTGVENIPVATRYKGSKFYLEL